MNPNIAMIESAIAYRTTKNSNVSAKGAIIMLIASVTTDTPRMMLK